MNGRGETKGRRRRRRRRKRRNCLEAYLGALLAKVLESRNSSCCCCLETSARPLLFVLAGNVPGDDDDFTSVPKFGLSAPGWLSV